MPAGRSRRRSRRSAPTSSVVEPEHRAEVLASLQSSSGGRERGEGADRRGRSTLSPDDTDWPQQDGLRVAGFPKAWDVTQGSSKVVVAVVDTGVDANHPDLRGALVPGWDFVGNDADPSDDHGHGTAVGGRDRRALEQPRRAVPGSAGAASVMPIKVLDSKGSGDDTLIAAGIVWATDHGARVINLSLGGPGSSVELDRTPWRTQTQGRDRRRRGRQRGRHDAVLPGCRSARGQRRGDHGRPISAYSWSNFGSWVRLAAPGCNVAPILGGGYGTFCGTSSATRRSSRVSSRSS